MRKALSLILSGAMMLSVAGCSTTPSASLTDASAEMTTTVTATETTAAATDAPDNSEDIFVSAYPAFAVTSESLHDGKWDETIANTTAGKNISPQLSWEPVEGASRYVVYMIDLNTAWFIHWAQGDITETTLAEGAAPAANYVGPYPPSGATHNYTVYVIALKNPVERVKGSKDTISPKVKEFIEFLDTDADGNTGNIISVGRVSGTYTAK